MKIDVETSRGALMIAAREPTGRDHYPVDRAIGHYRRHCDEYIACVRAGDDRGAAFALVRSEPARLAMVAACEAFNARWGKPWPGRRTRNHCLAG